MSSTSTDTTPAVLLGESMPFLPEGTVKDELTTLNLGLSQFVIRPATERPGVYTLAIRKKIVGAQPSKTFEIIHYDIYPVKNGKGKWHSSSRDGKQVTYASLTELLIATGAQKEHDVNVVGARFLRVALALAAAREREQLLVAAAAADDHIETTHPINGRHMASVPLIGRAYASHEPLAGDDAPLDPTLVEGRVSRFDQNAHVWTQMIAAEHKDHTLDVERQTRKSAAAIIAAREQWSTDWVVNYADAVNGEKLTSALCFGKHVPMPDDVDSPLSILNTYAS